MWEGILVVGGPTRGPKVEPNNPWPGLLALMVLTLTGVAVALVVVCLRAKARRHSDQERPGNGERGPRRAVLVVGPTEEVVVEPSAMTGPIVGPAEPIIVRPSATEPVVIGPSRDEPVVIGPAKSVTVEPPQRAAWDDRGWMKRRENGQEIYEGVYRVPDRRSGQGRQFRGAVIVQGGEVLPYIADPPPELRRHPKHPCFQLSQPPWFKLHWQRAAGNVDDAILYIERVLDEAINGRRAA